MKTHTPIVWSVVALALAIAAPCVHAAENEGLELFEKRIRPVLVERCYKCHSADHDAAKGGLRVDSRTALATGGDSGPAIVPGKVDESLLLSAIAYSGEFYDMPPDGKLADAVIADFRRWIELGAPDPRESAAANEANRPAGIDIEAGRQFWSFQPVRAAEPPAVRDESWPAGAIDRFVLAKLEEQSLRPAADADRSTLLRRLTFDLIGLPPTVEELEAFERDTATDAYERAVDRLLASPHFGERWGRHWLDVARYAESSGGGRSMVFPEAWRYRDYVIRAMNDDMPYDRFIAEQVAGDLLPAATDDDRSRQLVATAYLMLGPINYEEQDKEQLDMDIIDEQIDTLGRSVLGMTLGCARCHDHKFDPIPTRDYYALAGIFRGTHMVNHENVSVWTETPLPMAPAAEAAWNEHQEKLASLSKEIKLARAAAGKAAGTLAAAKPAAVADFVGLVLDDEQAVKVGAWRPSTHTKRYIGSGYVHDDDSSKGEKTLTFSPNFAKAGMYEVRVAYTPGGNRASEVPIEVLHLDGEFECVINERETPPIDARWVSLGRFRFDESNQWYVMVTNSNTAGHVVVDAVQFIPEEELEAEAQAVTTDDDSSESAMAAARLRKLENEVKTLAARAPARPMAMAVEEGTTIGDCAICVRGNARTRGETVPRGFLQVASRGAEKISPSESGRRELAAWLTSRDNPLTARVMANRVWGHLFGVGIVRTVDNFGTTGETPSHPELLDHLATRFMDQGWSLKSLIREIALSRTYRMSAAADPRAAKLDPDNRLLSHRSRRRLDAESIRDAILATSGRLDRTMHGRTMKFDSKDTLSAVGEYGYVFDDTRRSVYTPVFRNRLNELFEVFDFADPNGSLGQRNTSTVAPQALYLLNSDFVMAEARHAAKAALAANAVDDERIDHAFRATLGRHASQAEGRIARDALAAAGDEADARLAAWERLYQALFACIDFRYIE